MDELERAAERASAAIFAAKLWRKCGRFAAIRYAEKSEIAPRILRIARALEDARALRLEAAPTKLGDTK